MTDQDVRQVIDRLERLEACESLLQELLKWSSAEIASNPMRTSALERALQVAAQICIDVGNYLAATACWRSPANYADVFEVLKEQRVIDAVLAERMSKLARLRNILVHLYAEVSIEELYDGLAKGVGDFSEFSRQVMAFLNSDRGSN